MGKLWLGVAGASLVVWVVACGSDPSHPPNLKSGGDGGSGLVGGGGSGTGGSGTGGTACEPDPTLGSEISGNLIVYNSLLTTKSPYVGFAHLVMEGAPCGLAIGEYNGTSGTNFLIQGVKSLPENWVHIYQDDGGSEDVMTTLRAVNSVQDLSLQDEFAFVRASEIEAIYQTVGLTRDPTRGTVLVQVVEVLLNQQVPKAGVVISSGGESQVAYSIGSSWMLGVGQTDGNGLAALLNAEAADFPGKSLAVYAEAGGINDTFPTAVESDAVSIQVVTLGF
jgi:hypothetical protein